MENTSYALYIAVGVLIGIVILSLVIFNWRRIGILESTKDDTIAVKNKADFNAEYEAYNRGLMYGSDVLSCLNKAQNNNQKYVYNNYYGTDTMTMGESGRDEFFIDVEVTLYSSLHDTIKAYYRENTGKYKRIIGLEDKGNFNDTVFDGQVNHFKDPIIYYYYFRNGLVYQENKKYTDIMWGQDKAKNLELGDVLTDSESAGQIKTLIDAGEYHLLEDEDKNGTTTSSPSEITQAAKLSALITTVSLKEQVLYKKPEPSNLGNKNDWWYCTWTTAASDFKSRKFKCTGTEYNEKNGYIKKIKFEEFK